MENGIKDNKSKIRKEDKKMRSFARLGYSKIETVELVTSMNVLMANMSVHYQKLRNFHWNVKGEDFFDIHEQFENQYEFMRVAIDDIAERIRVFGQTPMSTMAEYIDHADINEARTDLSSDEMVTEIINDYETLLEHMFGTLETAIEHGDSGTEDMIKGFIKIIEKNHWMMSSFMNRG